MKKALLSLALACSVTVFSFAAETKEANNSDAYFVNDSQIENLFSASADVSEANPALAQAIDATGTFEANAKKQQASVYSVKSGDKSAAAALVLDFFLGPLGIHRIYLGTATMTWIGYILSCGGICGIIPAVDFWVMVFNFNDISDYVDNTKFFMW